MMAWIEGPLTALHYRLRQLRSDRNGGVAVITAFTIPVLIGFAGLAVDASIWAGSKNTAQGAADSAALSAISALRAGATASQAAIEAKGVAASMGFVDGQGGATVTVNSPPASGPYAGNAQAYEILISQNQKLYFSRLLGVAPTIKGRAVALLSGGSYPACLLALEPTSKDSIRVSTSTTIVSATNCTIASNSSDKGALHGEHGSKVIASEINLVGNYALSGGSTVSAPTIKTGASAIADPYASLTTPAYSPTCTSTNYTLSGGGPGTISPGTYCGGITVSGGSTLTMNPGVYVVLGNFTVSSSYATGSGVSIVITTNAAYPSWGKFTTSGGGSIVTLTAPSSGPMQGVALYMDRSAPTNIVNSITGAFNITGAVYAPSQTVKYSASNGAGGITCFQMVARIIEFSSGAKFGTNCGILTVPGLAVEGKGVPAE